MVILDTDIIIDHLRQANAKDTILIKAAKTIPKEQLALSVISIQELYEGKSTLERQKEEQMLATVTPLRILSYNYEIAEMAGRMARDLKEPIEFADAAIAATAIVNGAQLLTLNKKDFLRIQDLELLAL